MGKSFTIVDGDNPTVTEIIFMITTLIRAFKIRNWGNPFNYNRALEFMQADTLGYSLTTVGGGSDGINDDGETTEFKVTEFKGYTMKGKEKSHSFTYNGCSKYETLSEQKEYCYAKIMRDPWHHWTFWDYETGEMLKTIKISAEEVWKLIWPKWEESWYKSPKSKDPRIGGSIKTTQLGNSKYELLIHNSGGVLL